MAHAAIQSMNEFKEIIFAYGHSDEYIFLTNNTSRLHRYLATELTSRFNEYFTECYSTQWRIWFPNKPLLAAPNFETIVTPYATMYDLKDRLSAEQKDAHEKNLYNTLLWTLIVDGGRQLNDAELELQNTTKADKNEMLFQQFGTNYNNMPIRHKKGTTLLRSNLVIGNNDRSIIVPCFKDIDSKKFWESHDDIFENNCCKIDNIDDMMDHELLKIQTNEIRVIKLD